MHTIWLWQLCFVRLSFFIWCAPSAGSCISVSRFNDSMTNRSDCSTPRLVQSQKFGGGKLRLHVGSLTFLRILLDQFLESEWELFWRDQGCGSGEIVRFSTICVQWVSNYIKSTGENQQLIRSETYFEGNSLQSFRFSIGGPQQFGQYKRFEIYNAEIVAYAPLNAPVILDC